MPSSFLNVGSKNLVESISAGCDKTKSVSSVDLTNLSNLLHTEFGNILVMGPGIPEPGNSRTRKFPSETEFFQYPTNPNPTFKFREFPYPPEPNTL